MVGCKAEGRVEALFDLTPTPGIVQVGTPTEIFLDESIGCLSNGSVEGNMLVGRAEFNEEVYPAVVNLATGEAYLLNVEGIRISPDPVNYVAQLRDRNPQTDYAELVVYDLEEGHYVNVAEGRIWDPEVRGDLVVWEEVRPESRGIYGYDLTQDRSFTVTVRSTGSPVSPHISENWIVYLFYPSGEHQVPELRAYQIYTGEDVLIGTLAVGIAEHDPTALFDVSGGRIAWRVKGNEIHIYDLNTRIDESIFEDERSYVILTGLEMAGDLIMWSDGSLTKGYDLVHHGLFEIPELPEEVRSQIGSSSEAISESYMVWFTEESSSLSHFLMTVTPPPPGEPMPTPSSELLAEGDECRLRLFVAPIIRQ